MTKQCDFMLQPVETITIGNKKIREEERERCDNDDIDHDDIGGH